MKRRGFTLTELLIAITLMSILWGSITLSMKSARQTAQKEADRLAAKLVSLTRRADRENSGFILTFDDASAAKSFKIRWQGEDDYEATEAFRATAGCHFTPSKQSLYYNHDTVTGNKLSHRYVYINASQNFSGRSYYDIEVFGADGKTSHVFITSGDKDK